MDRAAHLGGGTERHHRILRLFRAALGAMLCDHLCHADPDHAFGDSDPRRENRHPSRACYSGRFDRGDDRAAAGASALGAGASFGAGGGFPWGDNFGDRAQDRPRRTFDRANDLPDGGELCGDGRGAALCLCAYSD